MLRVGQVEYVNTLPLFLGLTSGKIDFPFELISALPSQLNRWLREGEIDVGFISAFEYIQNREQYELVHPFCIAAYNRLDSVTLYVRGDVRDLDNRRVGLTSASASSSALVRLLCSYYWRVEPQFEEFSSLEKIDQWAAFLLIGDDALAHPHFDGFHPVDLAATWFQYTETPLPFAVIACRKEVAQERPDELATLQRLLEASLSWGESHLDEVIGKAQKVLNLSDDSYRDYFGQMGYRMEESERSGLERFAALTSPIGGRV